MTTVGRARTWLFVPGNAPGRFDTAVASGADAVILDLEDAVRSEEKGAACEAVCAWLSSGGQGWVRVNGADTEWFGDDLAAVAAAPGLLGVVVPKAEDADVLSTVATATDAGVPVVALVESALGVVRAGEIATTPGVRRLAFGSLDFAVDIRAEHEPDSLLLARSTLVLASRVAGLPAPIDGVTTAVHDTDVVGAEARASRRLGFGAKLCIHPAQLAATAAAFAPAGAEIAWATRVLEAVDGSGGVVTGPDGHMIDKPVIDRARAILQA